MQEDSLKPTPKAVFTTDESFNVQRLGYRPILKTLDAIAQSLAIGPIFSSAFVAFLIAGAAGGAAPLATLIGVVGVLALGWLISFYARRGGGAGAIYDYLRRVNPAFGLFAAGIYFVGTLLLDAAGFLVIGLLGVRIFDSYLHLSIPFWVISLVAVALIFMVNHLGVHITTRAQLTLSALSVIPLLILAVAIIAKGGNNGNTLQVFNPASVPVVPTSVPSAGLFAGILFAITLFIGFETSASLGEETTNPQRSIPRAVICTVLITATFYMLIIYASDIGFGLANSAKWASDPSPLDTLATRYVGSWLAMLVDIAVLFDALAVMSAFMVTTSRGWFALARHKLLPSQLAHISSRYHTPLGGNLLVVTCILLTLAFVAISQITIPATVTPGYLLTVFGIMSTGGSLLIELIYIGLCIAAILLLLQDPGKWWRWFLLAIALVTPLLAIYGNMMPFPRWPQSLAIYIMFAGIILSAVWTLIIMFAFPKRLEVVSMLHPWDRQEAT